MSTPFSCFPFVQELLRILRYRVACFTDSLFKCLSSPTLQVSLVFVLGTLESSHRCAFDDKNVERCVLDMLGLGGGFLFSWFGRFMCVLALLPVWYYGMELTSIFLCPFVVVCLRYGERSRRDFHQSGRA